MSRTRLGDINEINIQTDKEMTKHKDPFRNPGFDMKSIVYPYKEHDYSYGSKYSGLFPTVRGPFLPFLPFDLRGSEAPLNQDFQYLPFLVRPDKIFRYYYVHLQKM